MISLTCCTSSGLPVIREGNVLFVFFRFVKLEFLFQIKEKPKKTNQDPPLTHPTHNSPQGYTQNTQIKIKKNDKNINRISKAAYHTSKVYERFCRHNVQALVCLSIMWGGFQRLTNSFLTDVKTTNNKLLCRVEKSQKSFRKSSRGVKAKSLPG